MAYAVEMPALGESVTEGTVTRWLKQEGDSVELDEPLVEVSTDKVDTEIPSPAAGILQRIVVAEDETVQVGAQLAVIADSSRVPRPDSGWQLPETVAARQPQQFKPEPTRFAPPEPEPTAAPTPNGVGASDPGSGGPGSDGAGASGSGTPIRMPALGESVTEGTVTRWLKRVGDPVQQDEPLLEVSTDKVDTEIPSPVSGTVLEILVPEDDTVEVGAQLATVGDVSSAPAPRHQPAEPQPATQAEQDARPEPAAQPEPSAEPEPPRQSVPPAQSAPAARRAPARESAPVPAADHDGAGGAPYVTPLVRKLAAEHGVDLSSVQGTGVGGRIRKQDVLAAVEQHKPQPAEQTSAAQAPPERPSAARPPVAVSELRGKTEKLSRMRSVIAKRMVESLQISAQLTTVVEADITHLAALRDRAKQAFQAREGVKLSFLPFFAKATVEALKQHPKVNASINTEKGEVIYHGAEHLGIAVDTERGLLVPVIHDAGDLNIAGLARRIADLAERTRSNKITPDEMSGGTFTISNTGSRGALFDTPIILQPQVGILGTGTVVKRPAVLSGPDGDSIAIRSIIYLALSYDHRLVDGADAARFLTTISERLTGAAFEADLGL
ncbi:MAG TPA: 2-oxoglutarate dehydrogenase, E2 component, dihydrolipoamide succinyltransferase [Pseudonocardiaceae bacterium]|jgi:2-oxoglutarate dehydrogenase E2 component (dihydrolipoamide succinyltransferase)|nr:2-oxoglutarate dehydrogenase, E2 component, dihydrolipoamide succinyltransferase [Pseudonocardiaceae bacterium]